MRFFPLLFSGMLLFSIASCSTTERTASGEPDPGTGATEEAGKPAWFNASVSSESDSTAFTGYAMAVAANRNEAQSLSEESALMNLKFEIDRFAEKVRRELAEGSSGSAFGSPSFIRDLRNAVLSISTDGADSETEIFQNGNVNRSFTRVSLSNTVIANRLSQMINNSEFNSAFRQRLDN
jgi:hypothetical protein